MESITAVVVTYNRIKDLKLCIASLQQQTRKLDGITVVDNGSTDGTGVWLNGQSELTIVTQSNSGGAGGFATGIDTAYKKRVRLDLVYGRRLPGGPDALERLVASPSLGPCIKNSMSVSNKDNSELAFYVDRPHQLYRKVSDMTQFDLVYGVASFFNGTLINTTVVRNVGLPDKKLFIWGDEVEYMTRVQKKGYPIVTVPSSVFYHPPSVDRNGILWPDAWKQYYAVRNQRPIFQNIHGNRFGMLTFLSWSVTATTGQMITNRKNWFYNFLLYVEAISDSVFNNFGKKPNHILTVRLYKYLNK